MKWIYYFIAVLLFTSIIDAQNFNDYKSLEIESKFSSKLTLEYKEPNNKIEYVLVNLTFFPRNSEFQTSTYDLKSSPEAKNSINENFISYKWDNPDINILKYDLNSKIKTSTNFKQIKEKIKFPLDNIENLEDYTEPTETVTSDDPEIKKKAAELAQGEEDLYVIVHKIALWTKENINYSLETLTEDVSQNSSWVLENKKGVCDELTSLFVAMLRSINVPSRFVTGQAYTNVINGFGNHAWAEVYFPSYGWIPFDPTYGQMGYVDASHISMKDSLDVKESSVDYSWRSYGVEINSGKLEVNSSVISKGILYKEDLKLNLELLKDEIGPGSYIPLQIEIENLNDYYLPITLDITKAPKEILSREKHILLKPKEIKKIFFIIETPENLDNGFVYTSKIEVKDSFNNLVSEDIKFGQEYGIYTLEEAQTKISQLTKEEEKVYSANVKIECSKDKSFYYKYEDINLSCIAGNVGNVNLEDLDLCYNNKCSKIDLSIAEDKRFEINLKAHEINKEFVINVENKDVSKSLFLDLNILKQPNLTIKNLNYPKTASYNDRYKITFSLVNSDSEAKNVLIKLGENKVFDLEIVKGSNDFNIDFKGKSFYNKKLNLLINYQDKNDKSYSLIQPIDIQVINVPVYIEYWWGGLALIILIIIFVIFLRKNNKI